ncbi:hypothetical protein RRG08_039458 [Elysia crispata]|uniref:Uncharacterized protein n=1 Tax=Elysia crispata TaxID=231223 RepID=A0AAE0YJL5_9GAST|nr:hypothetical protein RRG08_039458 [Elysia crispata]
MPGHIPRDKICHRQLHSAIRTLLRSISRVVISFGDSTFSTWLLPGHSIHSARLDVGTVAKSTRSRAERLCLRGEVQGEPTGAEQRANTPFSADLPGLKSSFFLNLSLPL